MAKIKHNPILYLFLVLIPFSIGLFLAHLRTDVFTTDARFTRFADAIFESEVQSSTLTLHYTLAEPDQYGIHNYPLTLGGSSLSSEGAQQAQQWYKKLHSFDFKKLSSENQLLYDTLDLFLQTECESYDYPLLYEPLSPTLGIQAQLPILLAEYAFRTEQDVKDYLSLIQEIYPYFQEILNYEQKKSAAGLFMPQETAVGVIRQCRDFIASKEEHYLITSFHQKLSACDFLSEKKKEKYKEKNQAFLFDSCFPAYELLIDGLSELTGSAKNQYGLYYFPNGQDYYRHLVKSSTGIYDSIETLEQRLYQQLYHDYIQIQRLFTVYPDIAKDADSYTSTLNPDDILTDLQRQMQYDFPELPVVSFEIKYVDDALKEHLSPAFYLTPPIDTGTPNSIYLNPNANMTGITLYTTLAHEGFPGHLYQTQYFAQTDCHPLISLFASGGYVEGWATYIEAYAYGYAPVAYEVGQYLALNRSFYLCLYSILDIGIHYHGWKPDDANKLLLAIGIDDETTQHSIYQCLLEDPANYLKYCAGAIYLQDIRSHMEELQGSDFQLSEFHKKILETGPVPFPVLKKYIYEDS